MKPTLAVLSWLFATTAFIGGVCELGSTWVACWGLGVALTTMAWGLLAALHDERRAGMVTYREQVWARRDEAAEEGELPYVPAKSVWPNEVGSYE